MDYLETKAQMKMQTSVIESCFKDCINNFKEEQMSQSEKVCVENCASRYMGCMQEFGKIAQALSQNTGMGGRF